MVKRSLDIAVSLIGLLLTLPILLPLLLAIWWQDMHAPLYASPRVGQGGRMFRMFKLRSMVANADASGVDSTSATVRRITPIGGVIRRAKLDELPQLWNVLKGEMSLVGPRPQVEREVRLYTAQERRLLDVRPGITDLASIVFADLAEILRDQPDADLAYNQLVRPCKSLLGLFYVEHRSLAIDIALIALTALAVVSRPLALAGVQRMLRRFVAGERLVALAGREHPLVPMPPPGGDRIVTSRNSNPMCEAGRTP